MNPERLALAENLRQGLDELREAISNLAPDQWRWAPVPGAWSIAQCCEHVDLTENQILRQLAAAGSEDLEKAVGKDEFVIRAVSSRRRKVPAPENMIPAGIFAGPAAFLEAFGATRGRAIALAQNETVDLRAVCAPHFALQHLDGYQWLLLTATHVRRHLQQIEEIKAADGFPST